MLSPKTYSILLSACDDTNCKVCPSAGQCTECDQGYTLLEVSGEDDECLGQCP